MTVARIVLESGCRIQNIRRMKERSRSMLIKADCVDFDGYFRRQTDSKTLF